MRFFVFTQDYIDLDDYPDFTFLILEDIKRLAETNVDIFTLISANLF